ncbi:MFS transporter [Streptomyces sp. NPDC048506]|uniref:MFS transporter n=1 Tax=Streptomyces sp. NPDC048506 TaxID=3155028 RepID=UPI00343F01DC
MALLGSVFSEPARRDRAVAVWGVLASTGATLGTVLSGVVVTWVSWRWLFAVPAVIAVVAAWAAPRLMPPDAPSERSGIDGSPVRPRWLSPGRGQPWFSPAPKTTPSPGR